jgi:hypothetical protein
MQDCREKELAMEFLQEFAFAIQNEAVNNEYLYSKIWHYFKNRGNEFELQLFSDEYEYRLADYYFTKKKIFRNIVTPLFEAIKDIWKHYVPMSVSNHLEYINTVIQVHIGKVKRYMDISFYNIDALNDLPCKVIVLDATTPTELYENIFDRPFKVLSKDVLLNSFVYQLTTARYVMNTLDRSESLNKLLNIVDLICKKHKDEGVLVTSRKKYEKTIQNLHPEQIKTDHYPLVGTNEYKDLNVVVIFGTPEPSYYELDRKSIQLDYPRDKLHYVLRETNILQAIHRIRPATKENPTYIYILSNVELPLHNVKRLSIGKLTRLLETEANEYVIEEIEDRIREEIFSILETGNFPLSELILLTHGNKTYVREVITRMINEGVIKSYKIDNGTRGPKPTYLKLND